MPLPDERPRQSVANLIGRFENQVKRQPSSSPGSARSSSVTSDITGDSTKEELKERREWPPKPITTDVRPPPIVPSSSWSRSQATAAGSLPSSQPNPAPPATQAEDDSSLTPRPNSTTSIPDATKIGSAPKRQLSVGVTDPTPPPSITPTTAKPPAKTPVKAPVSKPPPSAVPKTPVRTAGRPSSNHPPTAQPIKPQNTGPASTSTPARKVIPKAVPVTPARAKTPSRAAATASRPKTPTSMRSKTPSSGLFAPTAASLARARNAQPQSSTPSKKVALSSTVAERLSKPTAASLSRARSPTSVPARGGAKPASRGSPAIRGAPKPRVSTASATRTKQEKPAAATAATATVVTGGFAVAALETEHASEPAPEENGHHVELAEFAADGSQDDDHVDKVEDVGEDEVHLDASQVAEELGEDAGHEEVAGSAGHSPDATTIQTTDDEARAETELHDSSFYASKVEAVPAVDGRIDEVKSRSPASDDIEDMVNLLESVTMSKARPTSISSIPDEVSEIPDEE